MSKNVAFIFALPVRTYPILITMPFGLNIITLLDKKRYNIDIYLSEYRNTAYDNLFSENVKIHFIDENYLWRNNISLAYFMVTNYFKLLSLFPLKNKYSLIFGSGMAGVTLGAILKKQNKLSKFIYLNDEFPDSANKGNQIWIDAEKNSALESNIVCTPDESRYQPLCAQIPKLDSIPHFTLPNTPLVSEVNNLPIINWHKYFNLSPDKKLFISAGGVGDTYRLPELMSSLPKLPENVILIIKGKNNLELFKEKYANIPGNEKVIWSSENFTPDKLHSLVHYCTASVCLYKNEDNNILYIGKSSGKLMRSLLLGKPVITSGFDSLKFVDELNVGKTVTSAEEIPIAFKYIIENEDLLKKNCKENYKNISYEKYWKSFESTLLN
jgi:hypothetical protein